MRQKNSNAHRLKDCLTVLKQMPIGVQDMLQKYIGVKQATKAGIIPMKIGGYAI